MIALLLMASLFASVLVGSRALAVQDVLTVLFDSSVTSSDLSEAEAIIWHMRVPRTVLAAAGGAALGVAGLLAQAHTRNPVADPGLLGINAGAACAVVVAISVLGITQPESFVWFAFAGAAITAGLVFGLAWTISYRSDASYASLALAGVALSALLSSITGLVLLFDASTLDIFRFWTVGSLSGASASPSIVYVLPIMLTGALGSLVYARSLDSLALGKDVAQSLGVNLAWVHCGGLVFITALAGGATTLVGPLAFVGLAAAHLARFANCLSHRSLIIFTACAGAIVVLLADVAARLVVHPAEIPVGVMLGIAGGPLFAFLVASKKHGLRMRGTSEN